MTMIMIVTMDGSTTTELSFVLIHLVETDQKCE